MDSDGPGHLRVRTYDDIATLFVVTKAQPSTTPYTCPNDPKTNPSQGHYLRLGVFCGCDAGVLHNFSLFECVSPSLRAETLNENLFDIGEQLVCATFGGCGYKRDGCDCSDTTNSCPLQLADVGVAADINQFPPGCVNTKTCPVVLAARFRASWSLYSDDPVTSSTRCKIDSTVALVECTRPGDLILLLDATGSITCTNNSDRVLRCVDPDANFAGDYASYVEYVRSYVLVVSCFCCSALLPRAHMHPHICAYTLTHTHTYHNDRNATVRQRPRTMRQSPRTLCRPPKSGWTRPQPRAKVATAGR
jgi:hypothetical protein